MYTEIGGVHIIFYFFAAYIFFNKNFTKNLEKNFGLLL